MGITDKQLELRRKSLGSSDMAVILGVSPFKITPYDIWADKRGLVPQYSAPWLDAGNRLERPVLAWAQKQLGPLRRNQRRVHPTLPLASNLDAMVVSNGEPVEAKVAGIVGPVLLFWGEEGTDEIPDYIIVQCHVHMMCTNTKVCHVPVLIGGRGFLMYRVEFCNDIAEAIAEAATGFWACVLQNVPPPDSAPSEAVYKRLRREPGTWAEVTKKAVKRYEETKEVLSAAKKDADEATAELMRQLGTAEGARLEDGRTITYFEQERKGYVVEDTKFRVLRIKKGK